MPENGNENEEIRDLPAEISQEVELMEPEPPSPPPLPPALLKIPPAIRMLLLRCVLIGCSALLALSAVNALTKSVKTAYDAAKEEQSQTVYNAFYDRGFQTAEAKHHVANDVAISVTSIQTVSELEVLRVSDVEYVILDKEDNSENITSWLEVPGTGVFTVDLTVGEYAIDAQRQYVHVRVPRPALSEFTVDYANIQQLFWDDDIFDGSVKAGEDLVREQIREGALLLKQYMTSNRMIYESAANSAKFMIANLVKEFNLEVPNLTVEVEFIDEL